MQITLFDLIIGLFALISLAFNFFQLYKDRINRQKLDDQKRLHETILIGLWQNMNEGAKSLEQLKRKGADVSTVAESLTRIINAQRVEVGGFLKRYYKVEISQETSPLELESTIMDKAESQRISIELIEGEEAITSTMIEAVEQAERYVFCVGGRSRNKAYLNALSKRVLCGDIQYIRVITGDHIRHQLCEHIQKIFQRADFGYLKEDKYGGILVTHDTVISAFYSSRVPTLERALKIKNEKTASDCRVYVQDLFGTSEKPLDMNFIYNLCTTCKSEPKLPSDTKEDK